MKDIPVTSGGGSSAGEAAPLPIGNRLHLLILQHPREKREPSGTAAPTIAVLRQATLAIGLSWPNLSKPLGRPADPIKWAVCYLGSTRPAAFGTAEEIIVVDRRGKPLADQRAALRGLEGAVLLDGSWGEAKTLWWRNPWLLKLRRVVLNPTRPSRYRQIRREPRREALCTLEAAALLLDHLDPGAQGGTVLRAALDRLLAAARHPEG